MTHYTEEDRLMALAGVFQAAELTQALARNGNADQDTFNTSIDSLFNMNPKDVAESLRKRNGMSIDKGLKLAGIYNSRLLSFLARQTETRFAGN